MRVFPPLLLMSRHSEMTLQEISDSVSPYVLVIELAGLMGNCTNRYFFHTSAPPLCQQRSKATSGSVRKDNPNLFFMKQGQQLRLLFRNWLIQSLCSDWGGS